MKKVYLDYASTTPVDKRVSKEMLPFYDKKFGNTMSLHSFGQEAKLALEKSRGTVAGLINSEPNEIIFTSSATESNNMALKGIAFANRQKGNHIIISSIEHPCIMETSEWLQGQGFEITRVLVDKYGLVNPLDIKRAIKERTIFVSIIHASNEIGTIQPIKEIGDICKKSRIYFHTDAVQSFGKILIDVKKTNIDLLTTSSHKISGPKGAAFLFVKNGTKIQPLLHGGGQEKGIRSSTTNIPAIVGFAKACEILEKQGKEDSKKIALLRDKLIKEVLKIKGASLNGHPKKRLPNNANFSFSFVEGESLVLQLDLNGFAVSTGSACSSLNLKPSHVLLAIGLRPEQAHSSLRVSLGRETTKEEINSFIKALSSVLIQLRKISPFK